MDATRERGINEEGNNKGISTWEQMNEQSATKEWILSQSIADKDKLTKGTQTVKNIQNEWKFRTIWLIAMKEPEFSWDFKRAKMSWNRVKNVQKCETKRKHIYNYSFPIISIG